MSHRLSQSSMTFVGLDVHKSSITSAVLAPGAESPAVGVAGFGSQLGVAVELSGQAVEAFGAVVVPDQEREAGGVLGPDAVAVGADDLAPLSAAPPLGPPLLEGTSRPRSAWSSSGSRPPGAANWFCRWRRS
jgi:hypothetical protein